MDNGSVVGHHAVIEAELLAVENGGLGWPVEPGNRSMLFVFDALGEDAHAVRFGAVVREVLKGGTPGGHLEAVVWFWTDLAEVYATPGTRFTIWYGHTIGHGRVTEARFNDSR